MFESKLMLRCQKFFLESTRKEKMIALFAALSAFSCCLLFARIFHTRNFFYTFLLWNLFLAWVPFFFSLWCFKLSFTSEKKYFFIIPLLLWLLFFPNAPYIITDLIHLGVDPEIPLWYDALLIFSFALSGLMIGLASLFLLHRIVEHKWGINIGWMFVAFALLACGYGIYVGRILRWNSWDIVINTVPLLNEISETIFKPSAIIMTIAYSFFTGFAYLFLFFLIRISNQKSPS